MKLSFQIVLIITSLVLLTSCVTNKKPLWLTNYPEDNDKYYYLVTEDFNRDIRIKFPGNRDFFYEYLIDGYIRNNRNEVYTEDSYATDRGDIYLVRISREFLDPVITDLNSEYPPEGYEVYGDTLFTEGEAVKSLNAYYDELLRLYKNPDLKSLAGLKRILDKIFNIIAKLNLTIESSIGVLETNRPTDGSGLVLTIGGEYNFSGFPFLFNLSSESEKKRGMGAVVENKLVFTPMIYRVQGDYNISVKPDFSTLIPPNPPGIFSQSVKSFYKELEELQESLVIAENFSVINPMENLYLYDPTENEVLRERLLSSYRYIIKISSWNPDLSIEYNLREIRKNLDTVSDGVLIILNGQNGLEAIFCDIYLMKYKSVSIKEDDFTSLYPLIP